MSNLSGFVKRIRDIMRNDAGINGDAQRIEQMAWMLFLKVYYLATPKKQIRSVLFMISSNRWSSKCTQSLVKS